MKDSTSYPRFSRRLRCRHAFSRWPYLPPSKGTTSPTEPLPDSMPAAVVATP